MEHLRPHQTPCETAIRLEGRVKALEEDNRNHYEWRRDMLTKLDALHESLHRMELRLYLVLGGIAVFAWAYQQWFGQGKP